MNNNADQDFRFNSRLLNSNSQSRSNLKINKKKNNKNNLGDTSVNDNISHVKSKNNKLSLNEN
jgi:hypothetical protein